MPRDYLNDLNASQRRAVTYGVPGSWPFRSGPVGVIAGAGTGKTKTIACRVGHLIVNGVDPRRIMLLTFTRRAAVEMTRRVKISSPKCPAQLTAILLGLEHFTRPGRGCSVNMQPELGLNPHLR